jgi:hypothetical protein
MRSPTKTVRLPHSDRTNSLTQRENPKSAIDFFFVCHSSESWNPVHLNRGSGVIKNHLKNIIIYDIIYYAMKAITKHYHRSSIVLQPEDQKIIDLLKVQKGLASKTQAVRFALQTTLRDLEYEQIRHAYLQFPETSEEIRESKRWMKLASLGMEKEAW